MLRPKLNWEESHDTGRYAARMDGRLTERDGGLEAILPASTVQNHAAFLARLPDGTLACAWFGGSLEGKSDISVHAARRGAPGPGRRRAG